MFSDNAAALAILLKSRTRASVRRLLRDGDGPEAVLARHHNDWRSELADLKAQTLASGVALYAYGEAGFPERLLHIPDAPMVLFCQGDQTALEQSSVAIVGARRASRLGCETAAMLAKTLCAAHVSVISGLALGIDSAAHCGAIEAADSQRSGGLRHSIAVLGSGLGRIQPVSNLPLADRLIAAGGLLISEYPLGMSARPQHFPERNRLISGLADVVVVVEAGERSGSLITARLALEQGREVLAVPGAISQPNSRGVHRLLKQGAGLVDCAQDVFDALGNSRLQHSDQAESAGTDPEPGLISPAPVAGLDEDAGRLLAEMRDLTTSIDELCWRCGESPARVTALLARLELDGFVARSGGGYIRRPFGNSSRNRR